MVDDDEEAMSPHRITDLRDQLSPPLRGSNLGKVDNGQISPLHYKSVSEAEDGKFTTSSGSSHSSLVVGGGW